MLVHVDISQMPQLAGAVGTKMLEVEMEGSSVRDLLDHIMARYGSGARRALLDGSGEIDPVVKVIINSDQFIVREKFAETILRGGDHVKIMVFVAGG